VNVGDLDVELLEVGGEVFGHALGEGSDEDALAFGDSLVDFFDEVVDLAVAWADFDFRVEEAGGADDLFNWLAANAELELARGGGDENDLIDMTIKLVKLQGSVVEGGGEAEAVFD